MNISLYYTIKNHYLTLVSHVVGDEHWLTRYRLACHLIKIKTWPRGELSDFRKNRKKIYDRSIRYLPLHATTYNSHFLERTVTSMSSTSGGCPSNFSLTHMNMKQKEPEMGIFFIRSERRRGGTACLSLESIWHPCFIVVYTANVTLKSIFY